MMSWDPGKSWTARRELIKGEVQMDHSQNLWKRWTLAAKSSREYDAINGVCLLLVCVSVFLAGSNPLLGIFLVLIPTLISIISYFKRHSNLPTLTCIDNSGYGISLSIGRAYEVIAINGDYACVVDNTGQDYLYPLGIFAPSYGRYREL